MISNLLTIVIPTRNRPETLRWCLQSIFERQTTLPKVIVSDNSTAEIPAIDLLRRKYDFAYVRQSGYLSMADHHNACINLAETPWFMLLHDDDELYPNIMEQLEVLLAKGGDAGVLVGGIQHINEDGTPRGVWCPDIAGTFKGEDIVLHLGLDYRVCPPGTIWRVAACHEVGGFPNVYGIGNEQDLVLRIAYSYGVVVYPEIIGRYRTWSAQTTDFSTPEKAEYILDYTIAGAQLAYTIGVSAEAADKLVDYMIWWVFRCITPLFSEHPFFVSRLCRKCELTTPPNGAWRIRVKNEHPYLFWKPRWLSILFFVTIMKFCPRPVRQHLKLYVPALKTMVGKIRSLARAIVP